MKFPGSLSEIIGIYCSFEMSVIIANWQTRILFYLKWLELSLFLIFKSNKTFEPVLTHWGLVMTYADVSINSLKLSDANMLSTKAIIGSDNGLSPVWWTNDEFCHLSP